MEHPSRPHVLVVGAGLAAARAVEGLLRAGFDGTITVVGDEPEMPYNRPTLSKDALLGVVPPEKFAILINAPGARHCEVRWRLGSTAESLNVDGRTAVVDRETVEWDSLIVATGVRPRRLSVPSPDAGRHVLRRPADAALLRAEFDSKRRVVVVGAGFIGCEIAAAARARGCGVLAVAVDSFPMARPLGAMLGSELRRRHECRGVEFRLGTGVSAFLGEDRVTALLLDDGTEEPAEVVVEALGSICNVELLHGAGFDIGDGVLVDSALRPLRDGKPVPSVAVAGDIARVPYPNLGCSAARVEHWSVAVDTGRRAGRQVASYLGYGDALDGAWEPMPSFWSDQHGFRIQSYGLPGSPSIDRVELLDGELIDKCVVGYFADSRLIGLVGLDATRLLPSWVRRLGQDLN